MEKTHLGKTKQEISAIGFGGMPLSIQGRPKDAEAKRVIAASLDAGVDFIDTADVYCLDDSDIGHNERLIASVLQERSDRANIKVATKGGMRRPNGEWTRDASPRHLREACEQSLRSLKADTIFLYQLHTPDPKVPFEKTIDTLAELRDEGKIQYVGLSNVSVEQIRSAVDIVEIQSVQNRLNPFFREAIDEGVLKECEKQEITFLAYSPLGGGRLSKKITSFPILQEIADRYGISAHAVTLGWVRAQGKTIVPIPGASKAANAISSARAVSVALAPEDVRAIDRFEFSRA